MKSNEMRDHLLVALRRMLTSLARLMIRIGIPFEEFSAITQEVYVESAIRNCTHHGAPSRKRISALTGLTLRKVNQHVDGEGALAGRDPTLAAQLVEVLHKWHTNPEYGGPYGIPLELEFATPPDRCFRSLVALVNAHANPGFILDELLRSGAILRAGHKRFRPLSRFLRTPDPTSPILIDRFANTVAQLVETFEYNMGRGRSGRRLDRKVCAGRGLSIDLVPAFESFARTKSTDFLLELDNWLASQTDPSVQAPSSCPSLDVGLNVFLYVQTPHPRVESLKSLINRS